ncbi:hypothetical protein BJF84_03595 [Rhodococcus sp. CUA-806]|nr:hypothetical protein BJF84_03595 [Rhodococcus sp. CUA-806]
MPFENSTSPSDTSNECANQLCAVAGRDRAVAQQLRAQAAKLIRLAETLETNSTIASSAAGDMIAST